MSNVNYLVKTDWAAATYTAEVYHNDVVWPTVNGHEVSGMSWGKGAMLYKGLEHIQKAMEFTAGKVDGKLRKKMIVPLTVL